MDRYTKIGTCWVIATFLTVISCLAGPVQNQEAKKSAGSPARESGDAVAAVVNGDRIMLSDLVARLNELGIDPENREQLVGNVLEGLIDNSLLVQFLSEQKLSVDLKALETEIARLRAEYEKEGQNLGGTLASMGLNEQKLRLAVIAEMQWQKYQKSRVTDKDVADFFAKYREIFDGTEVRASHVLLEVPADANAATRTAAKNKAVQVHKELAEGLDFKTAAMKYSACPSKEQGGDVAWFPRRGKMVEPFAKAAFGLKPGNISGIVESEFGYHLITVTGRKPGTRTNINDPELRGELMEQLGEQMKEEIASKLRKTARIEIAPGIKLPEQPKAKTAEKPTEKVKK